MSSDFGKSGSSSSSTSESFSRSFVDPAQVGFLENVRSGAEALTPDVVSRILNVGLPAQQDLASNARSALARILGTDGGPSVTDRMDAFRTGSTDSLVGRVGADIERFVGRQLADVDSQFAVGGTLGGGRNQVERALTREAGIESLATTSAGLRETAEGRALQAAGLEGTERSRDLSQILQGAALSPAVGNMGLSGPLAALAPFAQLAQIIGSPTVLSESEGTQTSQSSQSQGFFDALGSVVSLTGAI